MIACVCLNITEKEIKKLLEKGLSLEEIKKKLKLGAECGTCLDHALVELVKKKEK